jgi:hypothetical protein
MPAALRHSGVEQHPKILYDPSGTRKKGIFFIPDRKNHGPELAPGFNGMPGMSGRTQEDLGDAFLSALFLNFLLTATSGKSKK